MTKTKKNLSQKANQFDKKQQKDIEESQQILQTQEWSSLMDSTNKKMSRGAQSIGLTRRFRTNRDANSANSKGHHKEGHEVHQGPHKKK